jgi:hypothetical protein
MTDRHPNRPPNRERVPATERALRWLGLFAIQSIALFQALLIVHTAQGVYQDFRLGSIRWAGSDLLALLVLGVTLVNTCRLSRRYVRKRLP